MERVFTKDRGNWKKGDRRDYPLSTWKTFFPGFEGFTKPIDEALKTTGKERT